MEFRNLFRDSLTVYQSGIAERIRSPLIATLSWILFFIILLFYAQSLDGNISKLYTTSCKPRGTVLTKVKGFTSTEHLNPGDFDGTEDPKVYIRTWDATSVVFPVSGGEGSTGDFTIVTNLRITSNQTEGKCPEEKSAYTKCKKDLDCAQNETASNGFWSGSNGIFTGKCVNQTQTCEIRGWCPVQKTTLPRKGRKPLLEGVADFVVLLKNAVDFPDCGSGSRFQTTNFYRNDEEDGLALKDCKDNIKQRCPRFTMKYIVEQSDHNFTEVALKGGVFRIRVDWKCDFTLGRSAKQCSHEYSFSRVDVESPYFPGESGWSFRSVENNSPTSRTVRTHYGLKIIVEVGGEGLRFKWFNFINNMGSLLGLSCLTPLICDFLLGVLNWLGTRWKCVRRIHEHDWNDPGDELAKAHEHQIVKLKLLILLGVALILVLWAVKHNVKEEVLRD